MLSTDYRPVNVVCEVEVMFGVSVSNQCARCDVASREHLNWRQEFNFVKKNLLD